MILKNKTVVLTVDGGNCVIATSARRTIALLEDVTGLITFTNDTSKCRIGDELVLIIKQGADGDALQLSFTPTDFVFSSCGDIGGEGGFDMEFSTNENARWVGHFFFDGSRYLDTAEDC